MRKRPSAVNNIQCVIRDGNFYIESCTNDYQIKEDKFRSQNSRDTRKRLRPFIIGANVLGVQQARNHLFCFRIKYISYHVHRNNPLSKLDIESRTQCTARALHYGY